MRLASGGGMACKRRALVRAGLLIATLLALAGCRDLDVDSLCFPCANDGHCGDGLICDPTAQVCMRPGSSACARAIVSVDASAPMDASHRVDTGVVPGRCGDGVVNFNEACDDGNDDEQDACTRECKRTCDITDAIASGWDHFIAIRRDRRLMVGGRNSDHQLGDGRTDARFRPKLVLDARDWVAVEAGRFHSMALERSGVLWVWGREPGSSPRAWHTTPVMSDHQRDWRQIFAGESYNFGRDGDGDLWAWGYNGSGMLGLGHTRTVSAAAKLAGGPWLAIDALDGGALGLDANGEVYYWGTEFVLRNASGRRRSTPTKVDGLSNIHKIAVGLNHALALDGTGQIWVWGADDRQQLGDPMRLTTGTVERPRLLDGATDWVAIEATQHASFAIKLDGTLWGWGYNHHSVLGVSTNVVHVPVPRKIDDGPWRAISSDFSWAVALREDGSLWTVGNNDWGALGTDETHRSHRLIEIDTCAVD